MKTLKRVKKFNIYRIRISPYIQAGEISDKILNPLTTIKGFLKLSSNQQVDKKILRLLLMEIKKIEKSVNNLENKIEIYEKIPPQKKKVT